MKCPRPRPLPVLALSGLLAVTACSGGSGGNGVFGAEGRIVAVSFSVPEPGGASGGPNAGIPLPEVFADEALELSFDAPLEEGLFGGFATDGGTPSLLLGGSAVDPAGVPYQPYADQNAARAAIEIRTNDGTASLLPAYVVGRHRDKPNTLVVDPRVRPGNPFGLPGSDGFPGGAEFSYRIPAGSGLAIAGGVPVPAVGVDPASYPVVLSTLTNPAPGLVFTTNANFVIAPTSLAVLSVTSASGAAGTPATPIPADDAIIVTFTSNIDPASVVPGVNFLVRNPTLAFPIAGTVTSQPGARDTLVFTPTGNYGQAASTIDVVVGVPTGSSAPQLRSPPQGSLGAVVFFSGQTVTTLSTAACPACPIFGSIAESFSTDAQRDAGFTPVFAAAGWGSAADPGELAGVAISGSALASSLGNPAGLGTRIQRVLNTTFAGTIGGTINPPGLFGPFDDGGINNLGQTVNPGGGSHIMHLYEAVDLGSPRASLELVEWGPTQNLVVQTTYPNYYAWCGMTSTTAPLGCPFGVPGLFTIYSQNYNLVPLQAIDPLNPATPSNCPFPSTVAPGTPGGVRGNGPIPYSLGPAVTSYYPFPVFNPPFDYLGSGSGAGNLILEQNISPGQQVANLNRYRATAISPVRRLIGAPKTLTGNCNSGPLLAAYGGCETYDLRFTFVGLVASTRSLFYDSGAPGTSTLRYMGFDLVPSPTAQPAGTSSKWELEGASALLAPGIPSGSTTGFLDYWSGTPESGSFTPSVLNATTGPSLSARRYFRFRVELRSNTVTNERPRYTQATMAFQY